MTPVPRAGPAHPGARSWWGRRAPGSQEAWDPRWPGAMRPGDPSFSRPQLSQLQEGDQKPPPYLVLVCAQNGQNLGGGAGTCGDAPPPGTSGRRGSLPAPGVWPWPWPQPVTCRCPSEASQTLPAQRATRKDSASSTAWALPPPTAPGRGARCAGRPAPGERWPRSVPTPWSLGGEAAGEEGWWPSGLAPGGSALHGAHQPHPGPRPGPSPKPPTLAPGPGSSGK